jgi:malonyl-CoA O-methyltransferase
MFAIAFFGKKTLFELRESHQAALGEKPSHGQTFASLEATARALPAIFVPLMLRSEFEIEWHASVPQLLKNLKRIGAQNSSSQRPQGLASRQMMQRMIEIYQRDHSSENGIPATYEVIYLVARKC